MALEPWEPGYALEQKRIRRANILQKAYSSLVNTWSKEDREQCHLNPLILKMVVESYFSDLDRKKEFHHIEFADSHKRAGYTVKWLMKFRPVVPIQEKLSIKAILANEHFAAFVAFRFLDVPSSAIPEGVFKHILYALRYRPIDANAWALSFFLLQEAYGIKKLSASNGHGAK